MTRSRMYEGVATWNMFVGCGFDCTYCKPSFQNPLKRWAKANCPDCYHYRPHFHPERMKKVPKGNLIFVAACGDLSFAPRYVLEKILDRIGDVRRTFLIQSKNPSAFYYVNFPENVIFGTTLETNRLTTREFSKAPDPPNRAYALAQHKHNRKFITHEPILEFDLEALIDLDRSIRPERVWVGYDNYGLGLPEPPLEKTLELIERLEEFTLVGRKTLREPIA